MSLLIKISRWIRLLVSVLLAGCSTTMSNNNTKFDWKATESAPEHYPMQIIHGSFRYHGATGDDGLYIPSGATLYGGWGTMRSSHNVGPDLKPLPDRLDITYFSYAENTFYQGHFDLPYEKILALFRKGIELSKGEPIYYRMMVGVAPGGAVAVWVMGGGIKEVFFGQAKEIDSELSAFGRVIPNRAEYAKREVEDAVGPEILANIQKNGIPFQQWAEYRTQYNWVPTFPIGFPAKNFGMVFYNGESGRFNSPYEKVFTTSTHPVPRKLRFKYAINGQGKKYLYVIDFNEAEMLKAFSHLGANQQPLQLEFEPKFPKKLTQIRLRNKDEVITLEKFTVKEF